MEEKEVGLLLRKEKSHVETMRMLALEYGLPDPTLQPLDPELTKARIKMVHQMELFRECWNSKAKNKLSLFSKMRPHFKWSKMEAKARLMRLDGSLKFLSQASLRLEVLLQSEEYLHKLCLTILCSRRHRIPCQALPVHGNKMER